MFKSQAKTDFPEEGERGIAALIGELGHALAETETDRDRRMQIARECAKRKDILGWGKALMPYKFNLPFCTEMHQYFVDIRHAEFTDTEAPRDHAKTTVKCTLVPLFQALEEPDIFDYYLNVQATEKKGLAVNVAIRWELEFNEEIREMYGDQVNSQKWTDQVFVLKNGVAFQAIGAGQSVRGVQFRNRRPNYILVDDLYDYEDINNPESTEKKTAWFWSDLYPARAETRRCSVHVQGTAINGQDLLVELKTKKGVTFRSFSAVKDWDKGIVLWPELKTFAERVEQRDLMPTVIFAREYQNERRDEASSIVKRSWLDGWEFNPGDLKLSKDHQIVGIPLGVDPSIGEKNENDKTGMVLAIKTRYADAKAPDYWIIGLWNEHLSLHARVLKLQQIADAQPKDRKISVARIEGIAGFKDFVAEAKRRTDLPIREVDHVKDKISVLESRSWFFESKKVHISTEIPKALRDELVQQLTINHPKNDDLRDALMLILESDASWEWI